MNIIPFRRSIWSVLLISATLSTGSALAKSNSRTYVYDYYTHKLYKSDDGVKAVEIGGEDTVPINTQIQFHVINVNTFLYSVDIKAGSDEFHTQVPSIFAANLLPAEQPGPQELTTPGVYADVPPNLPPFNIALESFFNARNALLKAARLDETLLAVVRSANWLGKAQATTKPNQPPTKPDQPPTPDPIMSELNDLYHPTAYTALRGSMKTAVDSVLSVLDGVTEPSDIPVKQSDLLSNVYTAYGELQAEMAKMDPEKGKVKFEQAKAVFEQATAEYKVIKEADESGKLIQKFQNAASIYGRVIDGSAFHVVAGPRPAKGDQVRYQITVTKPDDSKPVTKTVADTGGQATTKTVDQKVTKPVAGTDEQTPTKTVDETSTKTGTQQQDNATAQPDPAPLPQSAVEDILTVRVRGGWKMDFTQGVLFYHLPTKSYGKADDKVVETGSKTSSTAFGALLHLYPRMFLNIGGDVQLSFSGGVGLDGSDVRYFAGGSVGFGVERRTVITYGAVWGKVNELQGLTVGDPAPSGDIPYRSRLDRGTFIGLTFNFDRLL